MIFRQNGNLTEMVEKDTASRGNSIPKSNCICIGNQCEMFRAEQQGPGHLEQKRDSR